MDLLLLKINYKMRLLTLFNLLREVVSKFGYSLVIRLKLPPILVSQLVFLITP